MLKYFIIVIALMLPSLANATPTISGPPSGVFKQMSSVVVSGAGFGTKSTVKPYLWAPFEGSINPSDLGIVTSWDGVDNMNYSAGDGVGGSGGAKSTAIGSWGEGANTKTLSILSDGFYWNDYSQAWYVYRRMKQNFSFTGANNWKYIRAWPLASDQWYPYPNFYMNTSMGGINSGMMGTEQITQAYIGWDSNGIGSSDTWRVEEIVIKSNSGSATTDAIIRSYDDGDLLANNTTQVSMKDDSRTMSRLYPFQVVHETSGSADYPLPAGSYAWVDDIYVDNTWQRVMICSGSAWATRGTCEIQIPHTTWADDQLLFRVNQGAFANSSTNYLYVVDAAGAANANGEEITFGAGVADTTAPSEIVFVIPATHADLSVGITTFTATDNVAVTGYCVTETNDSATCSWAGTAQTTFLFGSAGSKTLYAFARDAALNVSTVASDGVVITLPVANITNVVIGAGVSMTNN